MFDPALITIYGPFTIHAYGLWITVGLVICLIFLLKDKKLLSIANTDQITNAITLAIVAGFLGGRILCMLSEDTDFKWYDIVTFWEPGLSILGCIIGIAIALPSYLKIQRIPLLPFLDRIALYSPLAQAFGRIGCLCAGCCYGATCNHWWAIVYDHANHAAPLHIPIHPTQLYSSIMLFTVFCILYFVVQQRTKKAGILLYSYLLATSCERFIVDFMRADRTWYEYNNLSMLFSVNQWIALAIAATAILGLWYTNKKQ